MFGTALMHSVLTSLVIVQAEPSCRNVFLNPAALTISADTPRNDMLLETWLTATAHFAPVTDVNNLPNFCPASLLSSKSLSISAMGTF